MTAIVYKRGPDGAPDPETIQQATTELSQSLDRAVELETLTKKEAEELKERPSDTWLPPKDLSLVLPHTGLLRFDELSGPLGRLNNIDFVNGLVENKRISIETARTILLETDNHLQFAYVKRLSADLGNIAELIAAARKAGLSDDPEIKTYSGLKFENQVDSLPAMQEYLKERKI